MDLVGVGTEFEGAVKPSAIEVDGYDKDLSAHRQTEIPSSLQARFVYDTANNCIYAGYAARGLPEEINGWLIHQYTWIGTNCTQRLIAYDAWSNYLTASYA